MLVTNCRDRLSQGPAIAYSLVKTLKSTYPGTNAELQDEANEISKKIVKARQRLQTAKRTADWRARIQAGGAGGMLRSGWDTFFSWGT
jgi:hypothetical protein